MELIRSHVRAVAVGIGVLGLALGGGNRVPAESVTTQTIALRAGWNAVYLLVQPAALRPSEVFAGLPVDSVACFLPGNPHEQYLRQPGDAPWKQEGWGVWYAPGRADSFLSNLREIQAGRAYLVHAEHPVDWQVVGETRPFRLEWEANTHTFTGLPVAASSAPTFAAFFAGSPAHQNLRVYQLQDGLWRLLRDPAKAVIQQGEAYWIQTDTASTYQGPIQLNLPATGVLDFGLTGAGVDLRLSNTAPTQARLRLETTPAVGSLPLRRSIRTPGSIRPIREPLPPSLELGELAPGGTARLRLEPDRDAMVAGSASTLLKLTDGRGWELRVPVRATRE